MINLKNCLFNYGFTPHSVHLFSLLGLLLRTVCNNWSHTVYSLVLSTSLVYCGTKTGTIPTFEFTVSFELIQSWEEIKMGKIQLQLRFNRHAIAHVDSCWLVTVEDQVWSKVSWWNLWWIKWHWGRFFSGSFSFPCLVVFPPVLVIHSSLGDDIPGSTSSYSTKKLLVTTPKE